MVTACYIVIYYVTDYPMGKEPIRHEDAYRNYDNALLVAKDLAKCLDIVDDVYVIDGLTGEVINTILKDAPQEDKTEENDAPASTDTFDDGTGGVWRRANDGKLSYDCAGFGCSECAYCGTDQRCLARLATTAEDRDAQIKAAKKRMHAEADKTEEDNTSVSTDSFDDGTGGVWRLTEDNKWDYDCTGLMCHNCAYYNESHCLICSPVTREERDIQIESAKARMKK